MEHSSGKEMGFCALHLYVCEWVFIRGKVFSKCQLIVCVCQSPVPSSPVLYMQPSELLYQPMEQPSEGGCVQPAMPLIEAPIPEVDNILTWVLFITLKTEKKNYLGPIRKAHLY